VASGREAVRLGIDLGTSNTVAVLQDGSGAVQPVLFDGSELLPSAVFLDADDTFLTGRDALYAARAAPHRFEPYPKRCIDDRTVLLGDVEVPVVDLLAAPLRRVAVEAGWDPGNPDRSVTVTCPAGWGSARRATLAGAARAAGLGQVRLVTEPVAAAAYHLARAGEALPAGARIVVYDFGAGTFDASVVRRDATGFEVLATQGLSDVGGLDIDAAIIDALGEMYTARDEALWTRVARPDTAADRRARLSFQQDIRTAKELLSRASSTTVFVPLFDDTTVLGRPQLEDIARPLLAMTVAATGSALDTSGGRDGLFAVLFVGGSSRMPLAATMIHQALGVAPTVVERPDLIVAEGGLAAPDDAGSVVAVGGFDAPASGPELDDSLERESEPTPDPRPSVDPSAADKPPVEDPQPDDFRPARMKALAGALVAAAVLGVLAIVKLIAGPDGGPDHAGPTPTATSTTPTPTPQLTFPPAGWRLRLQDSLRAAGNWRANGGSNGAPGWCWFPGGKTLRYDGNPPGPSIWHACDGPRNAQPLADFGIEVTLELEGYACAGVYFSADAPGSTHAYVYKICGNGGTELLRLGDGPNPVQVAAAAAKVGPGKPHRIGVLVTGIQVRLYVDGEHVDTATDSRVGRGYYGLGGFSYAGDFTVTYFSDFSLWST
jgi:hypothetical protein